MIVTIHGADVCEIELLADCMKVCISQGFDVATIHCNERVKADAPAHRHPGWVEYLVVGQRGQSRLTIGVIQRAVGAPTECHT